MSEYTLNWRYRLYGKDKELKYKETVTGQETGEDVHSGFGYIAMLDYAKRVIRHDHNGITGIPKDIVDEYCVKNGYGEYYLMSLMFAIAADELKKLAIDLLSGDDERYAQARNVINNEYGFKEENFQKFFDEQTEVIYYSFFDYQENKSDDLWEKVFGTIQKTIDDSEYKKVKKFLKEHLVDEKFNGGCVGIYIFSCNESPIISFSGYKDSDINIKTKKRESGRNKNIIIALDKICKSLDVKLANTNEKVTKYRIAQNNITVVKDYSLKDVMDSPDLEIGKDFSCCERKIFTKFKRMNGTLHTSFFPCEKCQLGILYYSQRCVDIKCEWDIKDKKPVKSGKKPVCQK